MSRVRALLHAAILLPGVLALAACTGMDNRLGFVHKIDIQQGNVIEQELINRLERGMSKAEVRGALGTPLLLDPFHPDQWVYLHTLKQEDDYVQHNLVLHFRDDALVLVEGNVVGRSGPPLSEEENQPRAVRVPDPPPEGLLGRLLDIFDDRPTRRPVRTDTTGSGPASGEEIVIESEQAQ